ncbi:hypothetical protein [Fundidesulfovibrio butyratiphilus]
MSDMLPRWKRILLSLIPPAVAIPTSILIIYLLKKVAHVGFLFCRG